MSTVINRLLFLVLCPALVAVGVGTVHAATALKIVVYGGTGNIGQRIVHEALDRGHTVTSSSAIHRRWPSNRHDCAS
jgi:hypothetical protein